MDSNINCGTCEHWQKNSHKKRGKCMMSTEKNPLMQSLRLYTDEQFFCGLHPELYNNIGSGYMVQHTCPACNYENMDEVKAFLCPMCRRIFER